MDGSALDEFFANNTLKVTDQAEHDRKLAKLRDDAHKGEHKAQQYVFDEGMPIAGSREVMSLFLVGVRFGRDESGLIAAVKFRIVCGDRIIPLYKPTSQHHLKSSDVFSPIRRAVESDARNRALNQVFSRLGELKSKWKKGAL